MQLINAQFQCVNGHQLEVCNSKRSQITSCFPFQPQLLISHVITWSLIYTSCKHTIPSDGKSPHIKSTSVSTVASQGIKGRPRPDYQPQTCPSWETILTVMSTRPRTEALSGWQDGHQILPSIKKKKRSKCIPGMFMDRHYMYLLRNRIYSCTLHVTCSRLASYKTI